MLLVPDIVDLARIFVDNHEGSLFFVDLPHVYFLVVLLQVVNQVVVVHVHQWVFSLLVRRELAFALLELVVFTHNIFSFSRELLDVLPVF